MNGWILSKKFVDGANLYTKVFDKIFKVTILVAPLSRGGWNVEPSTNIFREKSFGTRLEALQFAKLQMKKY